MVLKTKELAVQNRRARDDEQPVGALVSFEYQFRTVRPTQGKEELVFAVLKNKVPRHVWTDQHFSFRFSIAEYSQGFLFACLVQICQLNIAPLQNVTQVNIVGDRDEQRPEIGNIRLRIFHNNGHLCSVAARRKKQSLIIRLPGNTVAVPVIIHISAGFRTKQIDSGQPALMNRLDPPISQTINRLFHTAPEIAAAAGFAPRQKAMGSPIRQHRAHAVDSHAFRLIGYSQHRTILMTLIADPNVAADQ